MVLKSFRMYNEQKGSPLNVNGWMNLEKDIFEEFRWTYQEKDYNTDTTQSASTPSVLGKPNTPPQYSPVQQFTKGTKKDIEAFPKLKDSK